MKENTKYSRNPNKEDILKMQQNNLENIGELHELGWNIPKIQAHFKNDLSRSSIQHYITVFKLLRRAEGLVNNQCMEMLRDSGLRFANCAAALKRIEDEEFIKVLEYCANPININISALSRDSLTVFVREVIEKKLYNKSEKDELHDKLRDYVARTFLYKKGIPSSIEVVLEKNVKTLFSADNIEGLRIDCLGYDVKGNLYGIEVKTNTDDFRRGLDTIKEYSKYTNFMYVLTSSEDVRKEAMHMLDSEIGVLYYDLFEQEVLPIKSRMAKRKEIEVQNNKIEAIKFGMYRKEIDRVMSHK